MAVVLVVDDEPEILALVRVNLQADGHDVVLASDGRMALEKIEEHGPDLILLDLMMPVLGGWGVLEALQDRADAPPVLVMTALSAESGPIGGADRAFDLGALGYVTKPFDPEELLKQVYEVLALDGPDSRAAYRAARRRESGL